MAPRVAMSARTPSARFTAGDLTREARKERSRGSLESANPVGALPRGRNNQSSKGGHHSFGEMPQANCRVVQCDDHCDYSKVTGWLSTFPERGHASLMGPSVVNAGCGPATAALSVDGQLAYLVAQQPPAFFEEELHGDRLSVCGPRSRINWGSILHFAQGPGLFALHVEEEQAGSDDERSSGAEHPNLTWLSTVDWHFQGDRRPETQEPYDRDSARLIVRELTAGETLSEALFDRRAVLVEFGNDITRAELDGLDLPDLAAVVRIPEHEAEFPGRVLLVVVVRHPHEGESRRPLAARLRVELEYPGRRGRFSLELSADFPPAASSKRAKETPQKSFTSLLNPNLPIL